MLDFLGFVLFRRSLDVGELHYVRESGHLRQRARLALPCLETWGILEIAEKMPRGIETLPSQHLDLRHDDGLHLLGIANDRRDEAPRAGQPAAARTHDHGPCPVYATQENPDLLRERCAAPLVAKRDLAALDALAVLLEVGLDHHGAGPAAHGAARLDRSQPFDLNRGGLDRPLKDLGLLNAVADGGLHGARGQLAVPFVIEIRGRGGSGGRDGRVAQNGRRRRHVVERRNRARAQINAPELLDQLKHIAGGLPAKLIGHPAGKRVKRIFCIRLRTAALEQRREPAREQRLGLPARERLEPHGERAEPFDAIADRTIYASGDGVVKRG